MSDTFDNDEIEWITVKGNHIPIKPGQTAKQAISDRFDSIEDDNGVDEIKISNPEQAVITSQVNQLFDSNSNAKITSRKLIELAKIGLRNKLNIFDDKINNFIKKIVIDRRIKEGEDFIKALPKLQDNSPDNSCKICNEVGYKWSIQYPYKSKERKAYANNCQRCVIAYEALRRGIECEANEYKNDKLHYDDFNLSAAFADYINTDNSKLRYKSYATKESGEKFSSKKQLFKQVEKDMLSQPEGARFIIDWSWKGGSGHTINAEKINGKIILFDSQNNTKKDFNYLMDNKLIRPITFHCTRVDDLHFSKDLEGIIKWKK